MKQETIINAVLELLRSGMWNRKPQNKYFENLSSKDWQRIFALIRMQTVVGICFQPVLELPEEVRPPQVLLLQWAAAVNYIKGTNRKHRQAWNRIDEILSEADIKPVVIKGMSAAESYPEPELRQSGDIDLYFPEKYKEALEQFTLHNVEIDYSEEHDVIHVNGIKVELHHNFVNLPFDIQLPHSKEEIEVFDTQVRTSDVNSNALQLLAHPAKHLFEQGIGIRHLCDWAAYLNKHKDEIDTEAVINEAKRLGMYKFVCCFTNMACTYLGLKLEKESPWLAEADASLSEYIFSDIILRGDCGNITDEMRKQWVNYYIKSTIRILHYYPCWPALFWKWIPRKMASRMYNIMKGHPYGVHEHKYKYPQNPSVLPSL